MSEHQRKHNRMKQNCGGNFSPKYAVLVLLFLMRYCKIFSVVL